ncbi:MAG: CHAT domain-containing protein [Bryobacteraceae bacterium]|jgi:CHAT domain-containing protein
MDLRRWPAGDWGWSFRLLCAENLLDLSRKSEARALLESAGEPSRGDLRARWMMDRARLLLAASPEKGRALLHQALDLALRAQDPTLPSVIRLYLGGQTAASFAEAEGYYQAALSDATRRHDTYLIAWARLDQGFNRFRLSRFDEAIPFLEQSRDAANQAGAKSILVWAMGNLGWCYINLGNLDQAMAALTQAEALSARIGLRDAQHRWQINIGNIYMDHGDFDRAAAYQQRALGLARQAGNDEWQAFALNNLALIALKREDLAAAQSFNDKALDIKRGLHNPWSLAYSELNAADIHRRQRNFAAAEADYATVIRTSRAAPALDVLWAAQFQLADLYRDSSRPQLAQAQFRGAIDTLDHEWSKLTNLDFKGAFLAPAHLIELFQHYVAFLLERGQTAQALQVAESSRARVLSEKLERAEALPPDFQIARLQAAARASHTVILSYWLAPNHSAVWVIGPGGLAYRPLPPAKKVNELVGAYTAAVTNGEDPLTASPPSAALYETLLQPIQNLIPTGSNVIVVPDGALHQLNFETLVVPGPRPHYWIEDVTLATAPSLRVLQAVDAKPRAPRLLLLGDPVLTNPEFAPLPNVKREIAAVEEHFPVAGRVAFAGAAAVPSEYARSSPAGFTHIHFATHAAANQESPLNSAIILSHQGESFKLYARDVAPVPLTADLVTISACQSAGPKAYSGEGLMGFAWAFLYAGARNVIATLWDEDDAASVDLMRRLYAGIAAGETPARALRAAKLALLHGGGRNRLPYYWGSLQVFTRNVGGGL